MNKLPAYIIIIILSLLTHLTAEAQQQPLTRNMDRPYEAKAGLEGKHIAIWGSHGLYYELGRAKWEWQRAPLFQTIEDKFPSNYVINYVTPMLENAGAVVLMPRERDANPLEIVIDNDGHYATSPYKEINGNKDWKTGDDKGFAYKHTTYDYGMNPFKDGTYRQIETVSDEKDASFASWNLEVKRERNYAVYVSYKSLPNSASDAKYMIYHKGGKSTVMVNQQMGGGTWIYLGTYTFAKGKTNKVVLSNVSRQEGTIITADAVKIGGGMGNIARAADGGKVYDNTKLKKGDAKITLRNQPIATVYSVSNYPRFDECARYWLQWAGMPTSVYSNSDNTNDYTDDYRSRGLWVNYMSGGSSSNPNDEGLKIPIDLSLAFHTDGGNKSDDRIIGTLGIYKTGTDLLGDGSSRSWNRDLCNIVYNSILNDIRKQIEPNWNGRNCIDRTYAEATTPKVPSMLLELLSHENFSEMRYGLDPRFQFIVSRAIYKGILKFLAKKNGVNYIVQPLPVRNMAATISDDGKVKLSWMPTDDGMEPTAKAEKYIVYKRIGGGTFDHGTVVNRNNYTCEIPSNEVVSFKVTALNDGGQSMPSEILSVGHNTNSSHKPVLIINGFNRISAPDDFVDTENHKAGFLADEDNGVGYISKLDYIGKQVDFDRSHPMKSDDEPGFGTSLGDMEKYVIAGNSFDYPAIHGSAILAAGYSFVSISREAATQMASHATELSRHYSVIDLILGKQKQCKFGKKETNPIAFKTFDTGMQQLLTDYCKNGGRLMVTGAYITSDLWNNPLTEIQDDDKAFAENILKCKWHEGQKNHSGKVQYSFSPLSHSHADLDFFNNPNEHSYCVETTDCILPVGKATNTAFKYPAGGQCAGVVFSGNKHEPWRTVVLAFPFETIKNRNQRNELMKDILRFFE